MVPTVKERVGAGLLAVGMAGMGIGIGGRENGISAPVGGIIPFNRNEAGRFFGVAGGFGVSNTSGSGFFDLGEAGCFSLGFLGSVCGLFDSVFLTLGEAGL